MLTINERIAQTAEHLIWHDVHGYSQPHRNGDGTIETIVYSDDSTAVVHGGDYDCSELSRVCVNCALTGYYKTPISYMWTGNEYDELTKAGFTAITPDRVSRGDIVLKYKGHTEIYLGAGRVGGARISENGTIDGYVGDQTGYEISDSYSYDPDEWDVAFTYLQDTKDGQDGDEMLALIQPDDQNLMVYFDGCFIHPLHHEHELEAIKMVYRKTHNGAEIPQFKLGDSDNPWGTRLMDAINRKM